MKDLPHAEFVKLFAEHLETELTIVRLGGEDSSGATSGVGSETASRRGTGYSTPVRHGKDELAPIARTGTPGAARSQSSNESSTDRTYVTVKVSRASTNESLGLKIGLLSTGDKIVISLVQGGKCDGALQVKDIVKEVDGVDVTSMSHTDFVKMLSERINMELGVLRQVTTSRPTSNVR